MPLVDVIYFLKREVGWILAGLVISTEHGSLYIVQVVKYAGRGFPTHPVFLTNRDMYQVNP